MHTTEIKKTKDMEAIKVREIELEREANVSSIESKCLKMEVSNKPKPFKIVDALVVNRLKTRFNRLKDETGRVYRTELDKGKRIVVNVFREA